MSKLKLEKNLIVLILILLGAFIIRVYGAYFFPLDSDEDIYLGNARLILQGWLPFRDFSGANQSPLYYLLLALFLKIGGVSIFVGRLLSVFSATITAFFIYKIGEKLYGSTVGLLSCFIFAFSPFTVRYGYTVVTEPLAIMFISIAIYLLILGFEKNDYKYFLLNGICLALAVFVRRSVGFFIIFEPILILLIYLIYSEYKQNLKSTIKNFFSMPLGFLILILPALMFLVLKTDIQPLSYFNPRNLGGAEQFRNLDTLIMILCKKALYLLLPALLFLAIAIKGFIYKSLKVYYEIYIAFLGFSFLVFIFLMDITFMELNSKLLILFCCILIFAVIFLRAQFGENYNEKKNLNKSIFPVISLFAPIFFIICDIKITNDFLIKFLEISLKILIMFLLLSLLLWLLKKLKFEFPFSTVRKNYKSTDEDKLNKRNVTSDNIILKVKKVLPTKFTNKKNLILIISILMPILLLLNGIKNRETILQVFLVVLVLVLLLSFAKYVSKKFSKNFSLLYIIFISVISVIILCYILRKKPENNNLLLTFLCLSIFSLAAFFLAFGVKIEQKLKYANLILIFWFFTIFYFYTKYQYMPVYFSELAPVACIMCGILIYSLYKQKKTNTKKLAHVFLALLVFSAIVSQSVYANDWYFTVKENDVHPNVTTIRKVGSYLSEHTSNDEEVCCYPIYSFEADRDVIFDIIYMVSYDKLLATPFGEPWEYGYPSIEDIIDYMNTKKVRYVVVDPMFDIYVLQSNWNFEKFIYSNYELEKRIDNVDILILKSE